MLNLIHDLLINLSRNQQAFNNYSTYKYMIIMNRKQIAVEFSKSLDYSEIKEIILFGSVARGEDTGDSDIDILIISSKKLETKDKLMKKVSDILLRLGVYISAKVISIQEYENLKNTNFISSIKKEGVTLG